MTIEDVKEKRKTILLSTNQHKKLATNDKFKGNHKCIVCHKQLIKDNSTLEDCYFCTFSNHINFYLCDTTEECISNLNLKGKL